MAENLTVTAKKAFDDARSTAHAVVSDGCQTAHNTLAGTGADVQKVADEVKTSVHRAVADAKIAAHEARIKLRRK